MAGEKSRDVREEREKRDVMSADSTLSRPLCRPAGPAEIRRRLGLALEQVRETGEGRECRRSILLSARRHLVRCVRHHLISLVFIVVTVETKQFPVASVWWIVIVVVVFVMNRELAQLLAVKFSSAVPTDPWKHFERLLSISLL
jgi:hypothetical protein